MSEYTNVAELPAESRTGPVLLLIVEFVNTASSVAATIVTASGDVTLAIVDRVTVRV
jgi:hypothetical protein